MKTKTFIILCLFLGIGLTQLSAQPDNKHGTGSVAYDYPGLGWLTGVYCDGVQVDFMEGTGDAHVVDHYTNGIQDWEILTFSGVGKSDWTQEIFTFKEQDKFWNPKQGDWMVNAHIKGDKGALYNISFIFKTDDEGNVISGVIKNATCTGNTK